MASANLGTGGVGNCAPSDTPSVPVPASIRRIVFSEENQTSRIVPEASVVTNQTTLLLQAAKNPDGWDKAEILKRNQKGKNSSCDLQRELTFDSTQDPNKEETVSAPKVGQQKSFQAEAREASSPLRPRLERKCKPEANTTGLGPPNNAQPRKKVNLKKVARQKAQEDSQAQDTEMLTSVVEVGSKRPAEAIALEHGILLAHEMNIPRVLLESDSLSTVQSINAKKTDGPLGHIFGGIRCSLLQFSSWSLHHLKRDRNRAAHDLTQLAKTTGTSQVWKGTTPCFHQTLPNALYLLELISSSLLFFLFGLTI
ncbi:hypothetical protein SO802_025613 [Lithocarpus litseifolius]|uniref:RNase H type-1 domain-containing protein n=1 Tax=Lithocarpus litseifolius TaxID=425828 RepID=A0AAW2BYW8_9ROSI